MHGKTDEIDLIMAIENIGNELKKTRTDELNQIAHLGLLEDIAGSLELIALAMQGVYK